MSDPQTARFFEGVQYKNLVRHMVRVCLYVAEEHMPVSLLSRCIKCTGSLAACSLLSIVRYQVIQAQNCEVQQPRAAQPETPMLADLQGSFDRHVGLSFQLQRPDCA